MAYTYDIGDNSGHYSASPGWIVAIFQLRHPLTYSKTKRASPTQFYPDGVELKGPPLVITDEALRASVTYSKATHVSNASFQLVESGRDFMGQVLPGDYVFMWMMSEQETYEKVLKNLLSGNLTACNWFNSGLKFYGRVHSTRKDVDIAPDGHKSARIDFTCAGFSEFDSQIFYDPYLAERADIQNSISTYFAKLGQALDKLISANGRGVAASSAIPFWLDLLLGRGINRNLGLNVSDELRSTTGLEAPGSFMVPAAVGQVFGRTETIDGAVGKYFKFADLLDTVIGVQKYDSPNVSSSLLLEDSSITTTFAELLSPVGARSSDTRRSCPAPLLGTFLPQAPQFSNVPVWSVLEQYLNRAVNEHYVCLRASPSGSIVPTYIARQLPFSSEEFVNQDNTLVNGDLMQEGPSIGSEPLTLTAFSELPRWRISDSLVRNVNYGRSDAMRFNFVHVYGDTVDPNRAFTEQIVENPPIRDDLDIARSGLRPYMQTVNCHPAEIRSTTGSNPGAWMKILADIVIGQHLTLTGTLTSFGIQAPICPGDNLEWSGTLFHIESVTHSCSIDMMGKKTFTTSIALSHGMKAEPAAQATSTQYSRSLQQYQFDLDGNDPGLGGSIVENTAQEAEKEKGRADDTGAVSSGGYA